MRSRLRTNAERAAKTMQFLRHHLTQIEEPYLEGFGEVGLRRLACELLANPEEVRDWLGRNPGYSSHPPCLPEPSAELAQASPKRTSGAVSVSSGGRIIRLTSASAVHRHPAIQPVREPEGEHGRCTGSRPKSPALGTCADVSGVGMVLAVGQSRGTHQANAARGNSGWNGAKGHAAATVASMLASFGISARAQSRTAGATLAMPFHQDPGGRVPACP
jgi:hypothetical protein